MASLYAVNASRGQLIPAWLWVVPFGIAFLLYEVLERGAADATRRMVWYSVSIILGAAILTRACRIRREFDLLEPIYIVFGFFVISYPVRALLAVWLDESWFDPNKAIIWKSVSAAALGFACFAAGYKLVAKKFSPGQRYWLDRDWDFRRAEIVSLVFLFLGFAGFVLLRVLGGTLFFFILLDSEIKNPESVSVWFHYVFWMCLLISVGALVQFGTWLSTGRKTVWTVLYCALGLLSTSLLSRNVTVLFGIMLAVCWHYRRARIKTVQVAVVSLLLVGYLGIAGLYREWISPDLKLSEVATFGELAGEQGQLVLRYVVSNFEQLSNLTEVISMTPSELPYQFGGTFTPVLLKPVPRVLMPSKGPSASVLFSRELLPEAYDKGLMTNVGAWGEWYLNFSWLGIALGMGLGGIFTAVAYRAVLMTNTLGRLLLYSSFIVALLSWLRVDADSAAIYGLHYLVPIVLALAYIAKLDQRLCG